MRYLLDTHALLWFLENNPALSRRAKGLIEDTGNEMFVSVVTFFEITIKLKVGKLTLPDPLAEVILRTAQNQIQFLPLDPAHTTAYEQIPLLPDHRNPFDRLLIATAFHEKLTVITTGARFNRYPDFITTAW